MKCLGKPLIKEAEVNDSSKSTSNGQSSKFIFYRKWNFFCLINQLDIDELLTIL